MYFYKYLLLEMEEIYLFLCFWKQKGLDNIYLRNYNSLFI